MWPLMKAELLYTRLAWVFCFFLCIVVFGSLAVRNDWPIYHYMISTSISYMITMGVIGSEADGEKRTRSNTLLPVSPRQAALFDFLYVGVFQLGMVPLWVGVLALRGEPLRASTLWAMVSHSGLVLSLITCFLIHGHLTRFGRPRLKRLSYLILFGLAACVVALDRFGQLGPMVRWLWRHYPAPSGALASTLLWLALSGLSAMLYVRRRSYLV
jgi:hypothetical protein